MGNIQNTGYLAFRDYKQFGIPGSGANEPSKVEIRAFVDAVDMAVAALESGQALGQVVFPTKAAMDAVLTYPANTKAEVYLDSTPSNNGVYQKQGTSGSGSWVKLSDLAVTVLDNRVDGLEEKSPVNSSDLLSIARSRTYLQNGARNIRFMRGMEIPAGSTGANSIFFASLPIHGLNIGTSVRFFWVFQASADIDAESTITPAGTIFSSTPGGNEGVVATLTKSVTYPTIWTGTIDRVIEATDTMVDFLIVFGPSSGTRTTTGSVFLGLAGLTILSTPAGISANTEMVSYRERSDVLRRAIKPAVQDYYLTPAGGDFPTIHQAVDIVGQGNSYDEMKTILLQPGFYTEEDSHTDYINPPNYIEIVGLTAEQETVIDARAPDGTADQPTRESLVLRNSVTVRNLSLVVKNGRYCVHMENGNATTRSHQTLEDCTFIHEGAETWANPTALGIGHHPGNVQKFLRVTAISPTSAIGFHNNIDWAVPAQIIADDCAFLGTGDEATAVIASCIGSGIMSPATFRGCTLGGHVQQSTGGWLSKEMNTHRSNRYEYKMSFDGCSPFDWVSSCDVDALELRSVAGASSAIVLGGAALPVLFGARPDGKAGGIGYAARVYSHHAVSVNGGEFDPGVTLGVRMGNRASSPLALTVAFDGGSVVSLSLAIDFSAMSNADIITHLNGLLATALGGSAGGRAFYLTKPYQNRAPIFQRSREGLAKNNGATVILKGHALAWDGRHVRLMTSADPVDLFAGIALDEAVAGRTCRFQRNGWINQAHLLFDGAPSIALRDAFEVGANAGELVEGGTRPLLRARSAQSFGATLELLEG